MTIFLQLNQKQYELPKYLIYSSYLSLYQFNQLNREPSLNTDYSATSTMKSHAIILIRQHIVSDIEA